MKYALRYFYFGLFIYLSVQLYVAIKTRLHFSSILHQLFCLKKKIVLFKRLIGMYRFYNSHFESYSCIPVNKTYFSVNLSLLVIFSDNNAWQTNYFVNCSGSNKSFLQRCINSILVCIFPQNTKVSGVSFKIRIVKEFANFNHKKYGYQ